MPCPVSKKKDYPSGTKQVIMPYMKRDLWLARFKVKRDQLLDEHLAGASWNDLARKYKMSVTTIGRRIKRAKEDRLHDTQEKTTK